MVTKIKLRQEANNLLLEVIKYVCDNHCELRFIQILWSLQINDSVDRFFEEPVDTLIRCRRSIEVIVKDKQLIQNIDNFLDKCV